MAKRKINPAMRPYLEFGWPCRKELKLTPLRKKLTPAQKRRLKACVMAKARTAGMKVSGR